MPNSLHLLAVAVLGCAGASAFAAAPTITPPYESSAWSTPANAVDRCVAASLNRHGVSLRPPCSDDVFVRRVFLDMIGSLPSPREVAAFRADRRATRRAALIDSLFSREEYADYQAMKWCDALRVKSEFPINLWPNAAQAYHHWIRDCVRNNRPYDQMVRDLLTSSGSNFRVPPVNFYRAVPSRDSASIAAAVALSFMGERFDRWPKARRAGMTALFSRVAYKKTNEWKEEIVLCDPAPSGALKATFPDGSSVVIPASRDPRQAFANWLVTPGNPWFARTIVNRIWAWTMGTAIYGDADSIANGAPAANPDLLKLLQRELVSSHYDLRHIQRLILNSRTYQQSSLPHADTADPAVRYAHYAVRRLEAEVLIDALSWIGGSGQGYTSATPEPYTFIPKENRAISLADGSITSPFLATFGRPARDTGLPSERSSAPSDAQSLYLLNSSDVQQRIQRSPMLRSAISDARRNPTAMISAVYQIVLSRNPTDGELAAAEQHIRNARVAPAQAMPDIAWALINSKEFLYRH